MKRPLRATDFGARPKAFERLEGEIQLSGSTLIVHVRYVQGKIDQPFAVIRALTDVAERHDARQLRIRGTIVNAVLYKVLDARYGVETADGIDIVEIELGG
jgi:hypothetical protein